MALGGKARMTWGILDTKTGKVLITGTKHTGEVAPNAVVTRVKVCQ